MLVVCSFEIVECKKGVGNVDLPLTFVLVKCRNGVVSSS